MFVVLNVTTRDAEGAIWQRKPMAFKVCDVNTVGSDPDGVTMIYTRHGEFECAGMTVAEVATVLNTPDPNPAIDAIIGAVMPLIMSAFSGGVGADPKHPN